MTSREPVLDVEPVAPSPPREPPWRGAPWVGWGLVVGWVVLLGAMVVVGEHESSYDDLSRAVADGDVTSVTVTGPTYPDGRGWETVEVHWRTAYGLVEHRADVVESDHRPRHFRADRRLPVVAEVEQDLASWGRDVEVERTGYADHPTAETTLWGWALPGWAGLLGLAVALGTFTMIVASPPPWRANRWAWFWGFALVPVVGSLAYLLISGPCGLRPPVRGAPRTRGGLGFVLAFAGSLAAGWLGSELGL